ncbi:MAG TPA: 30S ribosomal protein S6 [Acidimicrobiales bacterium]|nr:30S ribosomal protein S6 [Acidimicrobiales bacterium]
MRPYEVMIILDPALEDAAVQAQVDRSTELIRSGGAEPGRVDRWGKRRLAYEINHHREGTYVLVEAKGEPGSLDGLDRALHLADEVIRHKIVRLPDHPTKRVARPPADIAAPAANDTAAPAANDTAAPAANDTAAPAASDTAAEAASPTVPAGTTGDSATSANGA